MFQLGSELQLLRGSVGHENCRLVVSVGYLGEGQLRGVRGDFFTKKSQNLQLSCN